MKFIELRMILVKILPKNGLSMLRIGNTWNCIVIMFVLTKVRGPSSVHSGQNICPNWFNRLVSSSRTQLTFPTIFLHDSNMKTSTQTENTDCGKSDSRQFPRIHPSAFGHKLDQKQQNSIPSALIFGLIVILVLVVVGGLFAAFTRRSSWKFNMWLGSSAEADPEDGTSETNRRGQSGLG